MTKGKAKPRTVEQQLATILPAGVTVSRREDGVARLDIDPSKSPDRFKSMGGSDRIAANAVLVTEVLSMLPQTSSDPWIVGSRAAGVLALLQALEPTDAVEGMIAVQTVALHLMGLEAGRRTMLQQPSDVASKLRKDTVNIMRGMTDMLGALARHRGKGQQVVRVERVVVHEGGQAVVGNVSTGSALPRSASAAIGHGDASMDLSDNDIVDLATEGRGRG